MFMAQRASDRLSILDIACGTGSQLVANRSILPEGFGEAAGGNEPVPKSGNGRIDVVNEAGQLVAIGRATYATAAE
jgi:hypothetical protein